MKNKPLKKLARKPTGVRIDPALRLRLENVSRKTELPMSWFISQALKRNMIEFEEMANKASA